VNVINISLFLYKCCLARLLSRVSICGSMSLEGTVPEELLTVVWACKGGRGGGVVHDRPSPWRIGKRGTVFSHKPDPATIDIYKDVTHLYRRKRSGKNRDRTEWGTTLWIEGSKTQTLQNPTQVRTTPISTLFPFSVFKCTT